MVSRKHRLNRNFGDFFAVIALGGVEFPRKSRKILQNSYRADGRVIVFPLEQGPMGQLAGVLDGAIV